MSKKRSRPVLVPQNKKKSSSNQCKVERHGNPNDAFKSYDIEPLQPIHCQSEILLTIGMIVYNDQPYLRRCLETIQPLRDAIPCQLLITDTGSEDDSIAIATEFGAEVRRFTWCDDFAAARNTTIQDAKGQWYLYIDAADYLTETISELVEFFQSGTYQEYATASVMVRNVVQQEYVRGADSLGLRLRKMHSGLLFQGCIHEYLPEIAPCYHIPCVVMHDTGTGSPDKEQRDKEQRYRVLLEKMLQTNPHNIRALIDMANLHSSQGDLQNNAYISYLQKAWDVHPQNQAETYWHIVAGRDLLLTYLAANQNEQAAAFYQEYGSTRTQERVIELDMHYCMAIVNRKLGRISRANREATEYIRMYQAWRAGKYLEKEEIKTVTVKCADESNFQTVILDRAQSEMDQKHLDAAQKWIEHINFEQSNRCHNEECFVRIVVPVAIACKNVSLLTNTYMQILASQNKGSKEQFIKHMECMYLQEPSDMRVFFESIGQVQTDDTYAVLCRLRATESREGQFSALEQLQKNPQLLCNPLYADVLYDSLALNYGMETMMQAVTGQEIEPIIARLCLMHTDFMQIVLNWVTALQSNEQTLQQIHWVTHLMAFTLKQSYGKKKVVSEETGIQLFRQLAAAAYLLCKRIYRPDVFVEENMEILPSLHAMAFYVANAVHAKEGGNLALSGKQLCKAMKVFPSFQGPIEKMMEQLEQEAERNRNASDSTQEYAKQIKMQITQCIRDGQLKEAENILEQYLIDHSNDVDAVRLHQTLQHVRAERCQKE